MFSKRTNWPISTNALTRLLNSKKSSGQAVLDLTESNPTRCGFGYLREELLSPLARAENLRYEPDARGMASVREIIAGYYAGKGRRVSPEQIILTSSTSEAYAHLFRLLADPGDGVLVPKPSYPLFDYLADLSDVRLERYPLVCRDKRWGIRGERLQARGDSRLRALIVVNPNNPTGNFVGEDEREALLGFCVPRELAVISDEVFSDFALAESGPVPFSFSDEEETLCFTLGGISKCLGMPQMKLSWIVVSGPKPTRQRAVERLEIIADTFLSVNAPAQNALPAWFAARHDVRNEILARLRVNRRCLENLFSDRSGVCLQKSEGGWYAVLKVPDSAGDEKMALDLLGEHNVFVYPGYFFDFDESDFLVLSLLPEPDIFSEGVRRLSQYLPA